MPTPRGVAGPRSRPAAPEWPFVPPLHVLLRMRIWHGGGLSLAPGTAGREVRGVAVRADAHGFRLAIVRQRGGVRRAAGTEDLPGEGQSGAEHSQLPRGPRAPQPGPPPTFPQLRQWCRRRSRVKGERQAEHWLHVLSGTHSGRRWGAAGHKATVKAMGVPSTPAPGTFQAPWMDPCSRVSWGCSAEPAPGRTWQLSRVPGAAQGSRTPPQSGGTAGSPLPALWSPAASAGLGHRGQSATRGASAARGSPSSSSAGTRAVVVQPNWGWARWPHRPHAWGWGLSHPGGRICRAEEPSLVSLGVTHGCRSAPPRAPPARRQS